MTNPRTALIDVALGDLQVMGAQIKSLTALADAAVETVASPFIFPVIGEVHAVIERLTQRVETIEHHLRQIEREMTTTDDLPLRQLSEAQLMEIVQRSGLTDQQMVDEYFNDEQPKDTDLSPVEEIPLELDDLSLNDRPVN